MEEEATGTLRGGGDGRLHEGGSRSLRRARGRLLRVMRRPEGERMLGGGRGETGAGRGVFAV